MNIINFDSGCSNRMTVPVEEQLKWDGWTWMDAKTCYVSTGEAPAAAWKKMRSRGSTELRFIVIASIKYSW